MRGEQIFTGISREKCRDFVNNKPEHYSKNARIKNILKLRPVVADQPDARHQVDPVVIKVPRTLEEAESGCDVGPDDPKYVVAVLDVFSR